MTDIIPVTPDTQFRDIQFSRSKSGHVHSPWWSYDWKHYNPHGPYVIGSHFHSLRAQSITAFASALGIPASDVMVSVRENPVDGQMEWRCGSRHPVELPKPLQLSQAERMLKIEKLVKDVEATKDDAIDI